MNFKYRKISLKSMAGYNTIIKNKIPEPLYNALFEEKKNVFITGMGGTGKSTILKTIKLYCTLSNIQCTLTALTGTSAFTIGGQTIHRFSGIKLGNKPVELIYKTISQNNKDCIKRWKECGLLVIDEVSMLGKETFELIDKLAKRIRKNERPFGGLQVLFSADMLQIPPVNDDYCFTSPVWDTMNFVVHKMDTPYRFDDKRYFELLKRARYGELSADDEELLESRVDAYRNYTKDEENYQIKPTLLFPLKKDVEHYNITELFKLPGDITEYSCDDTIFAKSKDVKQKDLELYKEFFNTSVPPVIQLSPGAQVMLTFNVDTEVGLVNGARGVVLTCQDNSVEVLFRSGRKVCINPVSYEYEDEKILMTRHQIPLMLAYAISLHKSQSQTIDFVIADLGTSIFCPGLAYVALSRVKNLESLLLKNFDPEKIYADESALQFVKKIENYV